MTPLFARLASGVMAMALLAAGAPPAAAQGSADAQFEAFAKNFFYTGFKLQPTSATASGVHDYDAQLDDLSASRIQHGLALERSALAKLQAMDASKLSTEVALDRTMLMNQIGDDLLLNGQLQQWKHNPDTYTGIASASIFLLISRDFAPPEVRIKSVIARERQIPRLLKQAQANLTTVDATTQMLSAEQAGGSAGFFKETVPAAFASVKNAALQAQLKAANAGAISAVTQYVAFIKKIKPSGTFAIGKDAYEKRLKYEDALDMPVEEYLTYGEKALAQTHAQFVETAKKIDPSKTPEQVYASLATKHPAPAALLQTAQNDLVKLRAFIVDHNILTLPADANVKVVETPPFQRAFVTAAEDSPGPLEQNVKQAFYYVTPVDPSWPKARQEGFLAQFNDYQFPIISAHEVYPGHFTNFAVDKHLDLSLTRKLLGSSEFAEGWAHYDEQMMVDEGWGNNDPHVRLAQLEEALLRECRYVVGVKLHTQGWTLKQGEDLMTSQCFQTPAVALEETLRGTQDPMYGYYTLGKLMILKLREDYKKKLGSAYTLQKFHDALLAHGDPPLPLLRPILLGKDDDGKPL
jgi:uncharacterized protein (DUF885 family)